MEKEGDELEGHNTTYIPTSTRAICPPEVFISKQIRSSLGIILATLSHTHTHHLNEVLRLSRHSSTLAGSQREKVQGRPKFAAPHWDST